MINNFTVTPEADGEVKITYQEEGHELTWGSACLDCGENILWFQRKRPCWTPSLYDQIYLDLDDSELFFLNCELEEGKSGPEWQQMVRPDDDAFYEELHGIADFVMAYYRSETLAYVN